MDSESLLAELHRTIRYKSGVTAASKVLKDWDS